MKIAILTPTFLGFSGIDRVVYSQAEDLSKDNEITIFCFKKDMNPPKNVNIIQWKFTDSLFMQRILRLILPLRINYIKKCTEYLKDFDIVYAHIYPMYWIAYKSKKNYGTKFIAYNHGVASPKLFDNLSERVYMKLFNRFTNYSLKKADEIISVSKFLQEELKKETNLESKVVYNKVKMPKMIPKWKNEIRKRYNIGESPVLLFVGRISPHKGIHLLIEAFNLARKENSNIKLIIVGKPTFDRYMGKLNSLSNDSIIFTGYVSDEDLPKYYASCNIYVTASLWEGFDLPVVEAQQYGKPVVAFDIGPHKEVVKNGILTKVDISEFARGILEVLK